MKYITIYLILASICLTLSTPSFSMEKEAGKISNTLQSNEAYHININNIMKYFLLKEDIKRKQELHLELTDKSPEEQTLLLYPYIQKTFIKKEAKEVLLTVSKSLHASDTYNNNNNELMKNFILKAKIKTQNELDQELTNKTQKEQALILYSYIYQMYTYSTEKEAEEILLKIHESLNTSDTYNNSNNELMKNFILKAKIKTQDELDQELAHKGPKEQALILYAYIYPIQEKKTCTICYEEIERGKEQLLHCNCNHPYHKTCIKKWFKEKNTCPTCRNQEVCYICKKRLLDEEAKNTCTEGGSTYHKDCLETFFQYASMCPLCVNALNAEADTNEPIEEYNPEQGATNSNPIQVINGTTNTQQYRSTTFIINLTEIEEETLRASAYRDRNRRRRNNRRSGRRRRRRRARGRRPNQNTTPLRQTEN